MFLSYSLSLKLFCLVCINAKKVCLLFFLPRFLIEAILLLISRAPPISAEEMVLFISFFSFAAPFVVFIFVEQENKPLWSRLNRHKWCCFFFASFIHFSLPNRSGRLDEPWPWWMENLFQRQFILLHTQKMRNAFCRLLFRYGVVLEKHTPVKF